MKSKHIVRWLTGSVVTFALTFGAVKAPEQLPNTLLASLALILKVFEDEDTETHKKG